VRGVWTLLAAELFGTALLVAIGVSLVILDFGNGSPVVTAIHSEDLRRAITGFGFGCVGALIAVSPIGRTSGAHINPVVTLAFWLNGTMRGGLAAAYAVAQLAGGVAGACALLAWGPVGASVRFGATVPGAGFGGWAALAGEIAATAALVVSLFAFVGHARLRPFTPLLFPALYAVMVWLEAPVSGTSTNPARTLGPAVVAGTWDAWWAYLVGPAAGAVLGVALHRFTWLRRFEVEISKLYHFGHDPLGVLCRRAGARALHGG
jgi:aquaporin Z